METTNETVYTVVTIDYVGNASWIEIFNSKQALRKYLIEEITSNIHDTNASNAEDFDDHSLEDLMKEAQEYTNEWCHDGTMSAIGAIFEGGKCLVFEHDHTTKEENEDKI
jgi:hypothetical protein